MPTWSLLFAWILCWQSENAEHPGVGTQKFQKDKLDVLPFHSIGTGDTCM
jgi:hypothetical protein